MKVLVNGGLNLSTLDGWWAEAYADDVGWALGDRVEQADDDLSEGAQLYALLEHEVVPAFYDRADGLPRRWIARMRASMAHLAPRFSSVRMLQEYAERAYVPGAAAYRRRAAPASGIPQDLGAWARHLSERWPGITFGEMDAIADDGRLTVSVPVNLGGIDPGRVRVELYADPPAGEAPEVHALAPVEPAPPAGQAAVYRATIETARPPAHFTARVVPWHPEARVPIELPLVAWQR
jgi:starch phosphorylase